jgi:hypothetical protein
MEAMLLMLPAAVSVPAKLLLHLENTFLLIGGIRRQSRGDC